jgi:hypothetical protein
VERSATRSIVEALTVHVEKVFGTHGSGYSRDMAASLCKLSTKAADQREAAI